MDTLTLEAASSFQTDVLNLLTDRWLPVIRRSGVHDTISPAQVTDDYDTDPIVDLDWPRPDWRMASLEFLIGTLTTMASPEDRRAWPLWWRQPPSPDVLAAAFAPYAHAFYLDGDGPRFMQVSVTAPAKPIERMLLEMPGESTDKQNRGLTVHSGRIARVSRPAAAIMLCTLQSHAPVGGSGNRECLRKGGPLVTLVLPGRTPTLWQLLWANTPSGTRPLTQADLPLVFPWLSAAAVTAPTTPQHVHPLQCWWGMPRLIRLDCTPLSTPQPCDLTGVSDTVSIATWRQGPRGEPYAGWGNAHPLTPSVQNPRTQAWSCVPAAHGIGYHHWIGLVQRDQHGLSVPAATVSTWRTQRQISDSNTRLLAMGYQTKQMNVLAFVEAEIPLPGSADAETQARLDALAANLVQGANAAAELLCKAVRNALYSKHASVKRDAVPINSVRRQFWDDTERRFGTILTTAAQRSLDARDTDRADWAVHIAAVARRLFDAAVPLAAARQSEVARICKSRRHLGIALSGYGTAGKALFTTLGLQPPTKSPPKRKGS